MKKFWYIALLMICTVSLFSCSDDDEIEIDPVWKARNEEFINNLKTDSKYKQLIAPSMQDTVFYEVLKEGTGERPLATATVRVYYKGMLIDDTVFDSSKGYDTPETDDDVVAELGLLQYSNQSATSFSVIEGWAIAMQQMRVGDKWKLYIPWTLGYGIAGSGSSIPGCSTLIFEVELLEIVTQTSKSAQ